MQSLSSPTANVNGRKLTPITKSANEISDEDIVDNYLKDYDSLLKYCMKLVDDNKGLLTENCELRKDSEEILKMNVELLEENQTLRKEKEKLVDDSLLVFEYNEQLNEEKAELDKELNDIRERFNDLMSNVTEDVRKEILKRDEENNSENQ